MLIWADGFDHYGTGSDSRVNMLRGVWAAFVNEADVSVSNSTARTGSRSLAVSSAYLLWLS